MLRTTLAAHAALFGLCFISSNAAFAANKPSFNCAKAASTAEKAICKSDSMAASDAAIAMEYKKLQSALDPKSAAALAQDQRWFVGVRDAIAEAPKNMAPPELGAELKDRLKLLTAINPHPASDFVGSWHNVAGGFDITSEPDGGLKIAGNAAQPVNGNWVCDFVGKGKASGDVLTVKEEQDEGNTQTTSLRLTREGAALKAELIPAPGSSDVTSPYCGLNGSFDGAYFSVPANYR